MLVLRRPTTAMHGVHTFLRRGFWSKDASSKLETRLLELETRVAQLEGAARETETPVYRGRHVAVVWRSTEAAVASNEGHMLTKLAPDGWNCAVRGTEGWIRGHHRWSLQLPAGGAGVVLGICQELIDPVNIEANIARRYVLNCRNGLVSGPDNHPAVGLEARPSEETVPVCHPHDIISFSLDMDQRQLSLGINGKWNSKPTFVNLPPVKWFPYAKLLHQGKTINALQHPV